MTLEFFREYCLQKAGVSEHLPFDIKTLVFKVGNKMFALTNLEAFESINLKCDPERAIELREQYADIQPGWHMSKKHWNTVVINGEITDQLLEELIDNSYDLVVNSLTKKMRESLENR